MTMLCLAIGLVVVMLVGTGLLDAGPGALTMLTILIVTGIAWRIVKLIAGALLILISLG